LGVGHARCPLTLLPRAAWAPAAAPSGSPRFLSGAAPGPEALSPSAGETEPGAAGAARHAGSRALADAVRVVLSCCFTQEAMFFQKFPVGPARAARPVYPRAEALNKRSAQHRSRCPRCCQPAACRRSSFPPRAPRWGTVRPHALPEAAAQNASFNNHIRRKAATTSPRCLLPPRLPQSPDGTVCHRKPSPPG